MTDDVRDLRDLVADVCVRHADDEAAVWRTLFDLGLATVGIEESNGGSGGTIGHLVAVVEALGEHGVSTPLVERWLFLRSTGRPETTTGTVVRRPHIVPAGDRESVVLESVPWARDAEEAVFWMSDSALLVDLAACSTLRSQSNVAGEPRDDILVGPSSMSCLPHASDPLEMGDLADLLWAAAVLGAARGAYRLTRDYVRTREQFGAPLHAIPAVKRSLALMTVQITLLEAAVQQAQSRATDGSNAGFGGVAARVTAMDAATEVAAAAHQLHGAIGVTEEYPLHRFTTRLWAWRDTGTSQKELVQRLGARSRELGEDGVWNLLTAPACLQAGP